MSIGAARVSKQTDKPASDEQTAATKERRVHCNCCACPALKVQTKDQQQELTDEAPKVRKVLAVAMVHA